jgi:N-acetylneuraminic acid mutarotase
MIFAVALVFATTAQAAPGWNIGPGMTGARAEASATPLPDGRILIAGGINGGSPKNTAEIFDPQTNTFSGAGNMSRARSLHTAVLMPNGKVLVAGGINALPFSNDATAEIYDPITSQWTAAAMMPSARGQLNSVLLGNGKVLVCGNGAALLYDPALNSWSSANGSAGAGHTTATLLANGKVLLALGGSSQLYDPATNSWSAGGGMVQSRDWHTATMLFNGKVLVAGGTVGGGSSLTTEIYDPDTNTWSAAANMATIRSSHNAVLLPNGKVLVVAGVTATAEIYDPAINQWSSAGSMSASRFRTTAVLLPRGQVMVMGGIQSSSETSATSIYDFATGSWNNLTGMSGARYLHTTTFLPDNTVLTLGGNSGGGALASGERYDANANTWQPVTPMTTARFDFTATLMPSGKILVVGGTGASGNLASAELFDPASNSWSAAGNLATARTTHRATLLASGRVLVTGGNGNSGAVATAEIYDPLFNAWFSAGSLTAARSAHSATLLASGSVLVTGGTNGAALNSSELYDPLTNNWSAAGNLLTARSLHGATLLPSGQVLVAGGSGASPALANAEIYNPATNTFSTTGNMTAPRYQFAMQMLPHGKVLVAGGSSTASILNTAEVYDSVYGTWSATPPLAGGTRAQAGIALAPSGGGTLLIGGFNGSAMSGVERYDPGVESIPARRASLDTTAPIIFNNNGVISGSGFTPNDHSSSSGNVSAATNVPTMQLIRADNGQMRWLANDTPSGFSATTLAYRGIPSGSMGSGHAYLTVWVNGVPGATRLVLLTLPNSVTSLTSNANPAGTGNSVVFTANVSGSNPTGTILFRADGFALSGCDAVPLVAGSAQCTTTFATPGTRVITAVYDGDVNNNGSVGTLSGGQSVLPKYTVTPSASANGSVNPSTAFIVLGGNTTTLAITANNFYAANVGGTCGGTLTGNAPNYSFTTNAVNASCSVNVTFTIAVSPPDAPGIVSANAGVGEAVISFTAPINDGGAPINGYVATCQSGAISASANGNNASPITVTGLVNGLVYVCSVAASNIAGTGPSSAGLSVFPQAPATLTAVVSRKTHGANGTYDVAIDSAVAIGGAVTVESRAIGAGHAIVFQFNVPVSSFGSATVVDAASLPAGMAVASASGNEVVVTLTGVADNRRVTVSLAGVNGNTNVSTAIGFLIGDVNNNRAVNATDIAGVKARSGQVTDASNFRFDLNASGGINATDIAAVKARSGLLLP